MGGHLLPTLVPEVGAGPGPVLQERKALEGRPVWPPWSLGDLRQAGGSGGLGAAWVPGTVGFGRPSMAGMVGELGVQDWRMQV